jgi:hypothetical protein
MTPTELLWMLGVAIFFIILPDTFYTTYTSLLIDEGIERREAARANNFDLFAYSAFGLNIDEDDENED